MWGVAVRSSRCRADQASAEYSGSREHPASASADQSGGRDHEDAPDAPPHVHLPHVQPGHDGLARTRIVGEEEAERVLRQHALVHRDPLVRKRIDLRYLACEGRVELVPADEPEAFHEERDPFGVAAEVEDGWRSAGWHTHVFAVAPATPDTSITQTEILRFSRSERVLRSRLSRSVALRACSPEGDLLRCSLPNQSTR